MKLTPGDRLAQVKAIVEGRQPPTRSDDPLQKPLLYYPGLGDRHIYPTDEFTWAPSLKSAFSAISEELADCLRRRSGFEPVFPTYQSAGRWAALWLTRYGQTFDGNRSRFLRTVAAMESIPGLAGWAALSAIEPGAHIRPHCGVTNAKLRLHYGLHVEPGSHMRVGNDYYEWRTGDILIFDDSYEHEVWVRGVAPRIVLIVDFYHPELSREEINYMESFEREPSTFLKGHSLRSMYAVTEPSNIDDADWVYGHREA